MTTHVNCVILMLAIAYGFNMLNLTPAERGRFVFRSMGSQSLQGLSPAAGIRYVGSTSPNHQRPKRKAVWPSTPVPSLVGTAWEVWLRDEKRPDYFGEEPGWFLRFEAGNTGQEIWLSSTLDKPMTWTQVGDAVSVKLEYVNFELKYKGSVMEGTAKHSKTGEIRAIVARRIQSDAPMRGTYWSNASPGSFLFKVNRFCEFLPKGVLNSQTRVMLGSELIEKQEVGTWQRVGDTIQLTLTSGWKFEGKIKDYLIVGTETLRDGTKQKLRLTRRYKKPEPIKL